MTLVIGHGKEAVKEGKDCLLCKLMLLVLGLGTSPARAGGPMKSKSHTTPSLAEVWCKDTFFDFLLHDFAGPGIQLYCLEGTNLVPRPRGSSTVPLKDVLDFG